MLVMIACLLGMFIIYIYSLIYKDEIGFGNPLMRQRGAFGTVDKSRITEVSSNGPNILSELIKNGVVENNNDKEVRLKSNLKKKEKIVRDIAKEDFDKIWAILQESQLAAKVGWIAILLLIIIMALHQYKIW